MAQEIFQKNKEILIGLIQAIEIIYETGSTVQVGLWKNDENLNHNINQLKQQSERLSNSCTKLGLIDPLTMPLPGLQSLLDEVLLGGQSIFQCYSIIATSPISFPLREMLTQLIRTEFKELLTFLEAISSGLFESSKSSIGLVWDANKAIQNLPLTNKAAYRRGIMEAMTLIRETEREFQEPLLTSKAYLSNLNCEKKTQEEEGDDNDEDDLDDFDDIEEDNYTAEDILVLEPSLQLLNCSFRFLKELLNLMTEWSESPLLQNHQIPLPTTTASTSSSSPAPENVIPLQSGISSLYKLTLPLTKTIVDVGVELYTTPIETNKLKPKINDLLDTFQGIFRELDRIEKGGDSEESNEMRRQVVQEIRNSLIAIDTEARFSLMNITSFSS